MIKKYLMVLSVLILNLSVQSQSTELSMKEKDILKLKLYEGVKSTFKKTEYHYTTVPYTPSVYFHPFNLSNEKKTALLDSLKSNAELKLIQTEKDKRLSLCVSFPQMDIKTFSTIDETKLSLVESKIYGSNNKEVEFTSAYNYFENHIDHYKQNNKILSYKLRLNKELTLVDSRIDIRKCHGNIRFKLGFVVGYDSLRLDHTSISKSYKFGDAEIKVIDIIENKVIIQVIHSKMPLSSQQLTLLNFDSIDNVLVGDHLYYNEQSELNAKQPNPKLKKPLFTSMYTIQQVEYEIFKENTELSYEDYKKSFPLRQKNRPYTTYFIYCSYAPLKNSFILFKPIFGDEQIIETKL